MIWYKSNNKHTKRQLKSNNKIYKVLKSKIYKVSKGNNKILNVIIKYTKYWKLKYIKYQKVIIKYI